VAVPLLTYTRESWEVNQSDKRKRESAEMMLLQPCTLVDQKRSTDIHSRLKISNLTDSIERQKENWYGHKEWEKIKEEGDG
jgi:hypothetical protein